MWLVMALPVHIESVSAASPLRVERGEPIPCFYKNQKRLNARPVDQIPHVLARDTRYSRLDGHTDPAQLSMDMGGNRGVLRTSAGKVTNGHGVR